MYKFVLMSASVSLSLSLIPACAGGGGGSSASPPPVSGSPPASPPSPPTLPSPPSTPSGLEIPDPAPAGDDFLPQSKGWTLVWSDEFEGNSLDRTKWTPEESCWGGGNNERQCYTDREENIDVVNGLLRLKAFEEEFTGPLNPPEWNTAETGTQTHTSGKVRTREIADWKYGRFMARMKPPAGQGMWPAFWMMPIDSVYGSWPLSGEIDIFEAINLGADCANCDGDVGENILHGTIHFGDPFPNNAMYGGKTTLPQNAQPADGYNVYAVEWGEGKINWFLNDQLYFSATRDNWFTAAQNAIGNDNAPFDQNFYMMLNLAVGGNWPEGANETGLDTASLPNQFLIDWVRVYECESDVETGISCMA